MVRDERQPCLVDLLLFASGRSSTAEPRGVRDSEEPAVTLRKLQESFHEMPSQPASCAMRPAFGRRQRRRRLEAGNYQYAPRVASPRRRPRAMSPTPRPVVRQARLGVASSNDNAQNETVGVTWIR